MLLCSLTVKCVALSFYQCNVLLGVYMFLFFFLFYSFICAMLFSSLFLFGSSFSKKFRLTRNNFTVEHTITLFSMMTFKERSLLIWNYLIRNPFEVIISVAFVCEIQFDEEALLTVFFLLCMSFSSLFSFFSYAVNCSQINHKMLYSL